MQAIAIPNEGELQRLEQARAMPYDIARDLTFPQAVEVARGLPYVRSANELLPVGFGLFPPRAAEPIITIKHGVIDPWRRPIQSDASGMIGVLWNTPRGIVLRCWFRSSEEGQGPALYLRGPVDIHEDMIRSVKGIAGMVPALTGWQIGPLQGPPKEQ